MNCLNTNFSWFDEFAGSTDTVYKHVLHKTSHAIRLVKLNSLSGPWRMSGGRERASPQARLTHCKWRENCFHVQFGIEKSGQTTCTHTHTHGPINWVTHQPIGWQHTRGLHSVQCVCVSAVEERGCLKKGRRQLFGSAQYLQDLVFKQPRFRAPGRQILNPCGQVLSKSHEAEFNVLAEASAAALITHYFVEGPHDIMCWPDGGVASIPG